jgi:hypothetical protein
MCHQTAEVESLRPSILQPPHLASPRYFSAGGLAAGHEAVEIENPERAANQSPTSRVADRNSFLPTGHPGTNDRSEAEAKDH